MPFPTAGNAALKKVIGAMAAAPKDDAARIVSRIRVIPGPDIANPVSDVVLRALLDSVAIDLIYRDAHDEVTQRVVEPAGLVGTRNGWYLAGWCRLRRAARTFRLDRIVQASLLDETIQARSLDDILAELPYDLAEPAF